MINKIVAVWDFFNGKKTTIGVIIHFIAYGLKGVNLIDEQTFSGIIALGYFVMSGGLIHKAVKTIR